MTGRDKSTIHPKFHLNSIIRSSGGEFGEGKGGGEEMALPVEAKFIQNMMKFRRGFPWIRLWYECWSEMTFAG